VLGQHLTGIAFMAKAHEARLAKKNRPESEDAAKIVRLVNQAIYKTRELARGLLPVVSDALGLMSALQLWASEVEDLFRITCRFQCDQLVLVHDVTTATHLYHIAREAVNNAVKHGEPRNIVIQLTAAAGCGTLLVKDVGRGIPEIPPGNQGMGLNIMHYRAGMIAGSLEIRPAAPQGTIVLCNFPLVEQE
jgi:signal transduction histidine kinase